MNPALKKYLGTQARAARSGLGLTQAQVARRARLAVAVYGRIERGHMLPTPPTLLRLCRVLKVDANTLLGFSEPAPPPWWRASMQAAKDSDTVRQFVTTARQLDTRALKALGYMARAMLHTDEAPAPPGSRIAAR